MRGCEEMDYKPFIIKDLFDIYPTKAYKLTNKQLFVENGINPVVTNTSENHGRSGYSNLEPTEQDIITFSDTGTKSPDSFFFQEGAFIGYAHVQGMYPYSEQWNKYSLIYLTAVLRKKTKGLYDYSTKMTREIIQNLEVELPVTSDGNINFDFMENCITGYSDLGKEILKDAIKEEKLDNVELNKREIEAIKSIKNGATIKKTKAKELFIVKGNPQLNKDSFVFSDSASYPYFTRTVFNNGILGYVEFLDDEHLIQGNSIAVGMMGMRFFYMNSDFYAGQFTKTLFPLFDGFDEDVALYFIAQFNKYSEVYLGGLVRDFDKLLYNTDLEVPMKDNDIDLELIRDYIHAIKKEVIKRLGQDF